MKTTEILTLGAIVAGIFVLGKKAGVAGVGVVQRRKTLPWFLKRTDLNFNKY